MKFDKTAAENIASDATTTATATTSTSTASNETKETEERGRLKVRNLRWETHGSTHVQLVRDIFFQRYCSWTKATEIHRDSERSYHKYNIQTVRTKVKEARLLVKAFYYYGIWLDNSQDFLESCKLHSLPDEAEKTGQETSYKNWMNQYYFCDGCDEHEDEKTEMDHAVPSKKHSISELKHINVNKGASSPGEEYAIHLEIPNRLGGSQRLKVDYKKGSPMKVSILRTSDPEVLFQDFAALSVGSRNVEV